MKRFKLFSKQLLKNNKGQGMVEYILLLVVVVAIAMAFKQQIKTAIDGKLSEVKEGIGSFGGN